LSRRPTTSSDLLFYSPVFTVDQTYRFFYSSAAYDTLKADMVLVEDHRSYGTATRFGATYPVFEQHAL
jgi:hypothetical protein